MSVRGEFRRLVADTVACLRSHGDARSQALADRLEAERTAAHEDLQGAAERALEAWDTEGSEIAPTRADERATLVDSAERMVAVARVILGR